MIVTVNKVLEDIPNPDIVTKHEIFVRRKAVMEWIEESVRSGWGISAPLTNGNGKSVQAIKCPGEEMVFNLYDDDMDHCVQTTTYPNAVYLWLGI